MVWLEHPVSGGELHTVYARIAHAAGSLAGWMDDGISVCLDAGIKMRYMVSLDTLEWIVST